MQVYFYICELLNCIRSSPSLTVLIFFSYLYDYICTASFFCVCVKILEMRSSENQAVQEDPRGTTEHAASAISHSELTRRPGHSTELPHTEITGLSGQAPYTLNFSFEELNTIGLDEAPPRHSNLSWQVFNKRMCSTCLPVQ